jgi:hypothetical protein
MKIMVLFASLICVLASCDRPECKNANPVFDQYAPDTKQYKAELIKQINAHKELRYWIDQYVKKDGELYMSIFIQGDGVCAKGLMDITSGKGLENYKGMKGLSYSGAELKGLKYRIDTAAGGYSLVFESVDWIAD